MGKKKEKAGIIPFFFRHNEPRMLFMRPSDPDYGGTKFQIAKGNIDKGENPLEAALRECSEELGLIDTNVLWIEKCGVFFGNHHIYVALLKTDCHSSFTDFTYETEETGWLTKNEFLEVGRKKHKPVIEECTAYFEHCLKKRG